MKKGSFPVAQPCGMAKPHAAPLETEHCILLAVAQPVAWLCHYADPFILLHVVAQPGCATMRKSQIFLFIPSFLPF